MKATCKKKIKMWIIILAGVEQRRESDDIEDTL